MSNVTKNKLERSLRYSKSFLKALLCISIPDCFPPSSVSVQATAGSIFEGLLFHKPHGLKVKVRSEHTLELEDTVFFLTYNSSKLSAATAFSSFSHLERVSGEQTCSFAHLLSHSFSLTLMRFPSTGTSAKKHNIYVKCCRHYVGLPAN